MGFKFHKINIKRPGLLIRSVGRKIAAAAKAVQTVYKPSVEKTDAARPDSVEDDDFDAELSREETDGLRVDWTAMRGATDAALTATVREFLDPFDQLGESYSIVLWRTQGAFHYAACVGLTYDGTFEDMWRYIVRIPGHGNKSAWTDEDAYNLQREVDTMEYVRFNTDVPIPQIVGYNRLLENPLGMPYTVLDHKGEENAYNLWFEEDYYSEADVWKTADKPPADIERKRVNFLQSLAREMSALQKVCFTQIGAPIMNDDNGPGPFPAGQVYEFRSCKDVHLPSERPAFSTTQDFIAYGMDKLFGPDLPSLSTDEEELPVKTLITTGERKIMEIVFAQPAFNPDKAPETFTLHHNDFDLQNILIDDDGNIAGIIDWDGSYAAPRCIGAAAVPLFLRKDWRPSFCNSLDEAPHMAWNTEHYRQIYATALREASPDPDVQFTTKSPIYCAAIAALYENGDVHDFTDKIIREIPGIRMSPKEIKIGLGQGWPACEEMLREEIAKIMAPELPKSEFPEASASV